MARCENNSDCRDGYVCANPTEAPWSGQIMDNDQNQLTCLVPATFPPDGGADGGEPDAFAPVCTANGPSDASIDVSAPSISLEAGTVPPLFPDAGADGG